MECNNEAVERQKLVSNDGDGENDEEPSGNLPPSTSTAPKSIQIPISPVLSNKIFSSGETSRSQNSTTCSIGKSNNTDPGLPSSRILYINEKKVQDAKSDYKAKLRKIQRDESPSTSSSTQNHPPVVDKNSDIKYSFASRPIKHHSFISEVPDVRHMERALLGLLEDFHSGKLRAFGSGCTMEQMTDIREQQERLAKLHFELGHGQQQMNNGGGGTGGNAQDNMLQLVEKLEQLSVSIEKLHSSNLDIQ